MPPIPPLRAWIRRVRDNIPAGYCLRTGQEGCVEWIKRQVIYHGKEHPPVLGAADVEALVTHLAVEDLQTRAQRTAACAARSTMRAKGLALALPQAGTGIQ